MLMKINKKRNAITQITKTSETNKKVPDKVN